MFDIKSIIFIVEKEVIFFERGELLIVEMYFQIFQFTFIR